MPIGELSVLAAALTFSITGVVQKLLVRRFRPLTLGALGAAGGAFASLLMVLATSRLGDVADTPVLYLLLGILGGIINIGLGDPLYILFLRNVDISKAWPIMAGLLNSYALLFGVVILGESPNLYDLGGVAVVASGVYLLSFGQRRYTDKNQASWLGLRGLLLMALVAGFWMSGLTLQGFALRHMEAPVLNMVRLTVVSMFLTSLASMGFNEVLLPMEGRAVQGFVRRVRLALSQGLVVRTFRRCMRMEGKTRSAVAHRDSLRRRRRIQYSWSYRNSGAAVANGAVSLGVGSTLSLIGIERAGLFISSVLGSSQIFWTTTLSIIVLKERMNKAGIAGVMAMFAGITIIVLL